MKRGTSNVVFVLHFLSVAGLCIVQYSYILTHTQLRTSTQHTTPPPHHPAFISWHKQRAFCGCGDKLHGAHGCETGPFALASLRSLWIKINDLSFFLSFFLSFLLRVLFTSDWPSLFSLPPPGMKISLIDTSQPPLKVVGNQKVGGSGMCQSVPIFLGPRRSMFFSLSILLSSLILSISVSAPVKQNE